MLLDFLINLNSQVNYIKAYNLVISWTKMHIRVRNGGDYSHKKRGYGELS